MSEFIDSALALEYNPIDSNYRTIGTNKILSGSRLRRLNSLGIPRVYTKIWLSRSPTSDIQAVALDSKNKKQYYYSKEWEKEREEKKATRVSGLANIIPHIVKRTNLDKKRKGWPKEKTMAYMLDIVMETNIRIGNKKYLDKNNSYGLTTLRKEHLTLHPKYAQIQFRGKHGVQQNITIKAIRLIRFLETMSKLPEDWLMKYQGSDNKYYRVSAQDLNNYLHSIAGPSFTIKDYRTWGANMTFLENLLYQPIPNSTSDIKKNINIALEKTAEKLGNNKATSKKSYVMGEIIDQYTKSPESVIKKGINNFMSYY